MSKIYDDICFYCYFGNGDLFNSREFIKELLYNFPTTKLTYAHSKSPRMFEDIDRLNYSKIIADIMPQNKHSLIGNAKDLYINSWIGLDSKYVLPGIGVTLRKYKELYNKILKDAETGFQFESEDKCYIPTINYKKLKYYKNVYNYFRKKKNNFVLISNGDVFSNQSNNFDFNPLIDSVCDEFKEFIFIATEDRGLVKDNLVYTNDIIRADDGFDLNEISYLSTFVDTIIGRSSGPYVFAQVSENLYNNNKKFLSFTYHINASDLAMGIPTPAKKYWSREFEFDRALNRVKEVINA